jgi:hypothetical protein
MQALGFQTVHMLPAAAMADTNPLYQAATLGDVGAMQALLVDPRVNPAARNSVASRGAVFWGRTDAVHLLLADGRADPAAEACGACAPRMAARKGHVAVVRASLADGRANRVVGANAIGRSPCNKRHRAMFRAAQALAAAPSLAGRSRTPPPPPPGQE